MSKALTDKIWMDRARREEGAAEVVEASAKTAKWLQQLIEREERLTGEGNAYGEVYSERQYGLAAGPIVQREALRAKILQATRERGLTLVEIAEILEFPPSEVMPHVVALRRRGQLLLEKVEDEVTPVYAAAEQAEES